MARSRTLDLLLVAFLLPIALVVGVLIAIGIVIDSPGPVFYRARRVGRGGVPFDMLKFRKMREDSSGMLLTGDNDARFTPIGQVLAKTRLDELPQLINVVRGEMSFVGPRPEVEPFVAARPEDFATVLTVRPGITGLAQLRYADEGALLAAAQDPERLYVDQILPVKVALDLEYVRTKSVVGDLRILCRTALIALRLVERASGTNSLGLTRMRPRLGLMTVLPVLLLATFVLTAGPLH